MLDVMYIVNVFNGSKFAGFKTFDSQDSAISFADQHKKFKIFKRTHKGVNEVESYGF